MAGEKMDIPEARSATAEDMVEATVRGADIGI